MSDCLEQRDSEICLLFETRSSCRNSSIVTSPHAYTPHDGAKAALEAELHVVVEEAC